MTLQDIQEMWAKDSVIRPDDLTTELFNITRLHSKYFNILNISRQSLKRCEIEYNRLKKIKREYYLGRFSTKTLEELKWPKIDYEAKPSDVADYLRGDEDLCKIEERSCIQEIKIEFLKDVIKSIHNRGINMRTAIQWEMFKSGERT